MKCLIIGGNRFVGLRLSRMLAARPDIELHILNRSGSCPGEIRAHVHQGNRRNLISIPSLSRDWDVVVDFACYNKADAIGALEFFNKVGSYIFISTVAVYDSKNRPLSEEDFNAGAYRPSVPDSTYSEGKRQAEAVFAQQDRWPVLSVRLPFILGPDDYTRRLDFHIERVVKGEPVYIANEAADVSLIHAEDAAKFLAWAVDKRLSGALNVASPDSLSAAALLTQIGLLLNKETITTPADSPAARSPYATRIRRPMNVQKMIDQGFTVPPISSWLPPLIVERESQ